jgi:hypothetical protein
VATVDQAQAQPVQPLAAVGAGVPQGIELRHLQYFVALADAGSFTHAAERIFITQPTLSQQIRRLEEIVGAPLLQRRREGLRLTAAGSVLLDASRTVLSLVGHEVRRTRQAAGLGRPRAQPGTYDAWTQVVRQADPRFGFTDPPFGRSLAMTLAFAAAGDRPAALLTGPATPAGGARRLRRAVSVGGCGMVRVGLAQRPLTAAAALVWNGHLPRPLQQVLFDAADALTGPVPAQPAGLVSLTSA